MTKKTHIIVDSTILRSNPFLETGEGPWLKKLSNDEHVIIHLSEIVMNEVITQLQESYKKTTTIALQEFSKKTKKNDLPTDFTNKLKDLEEDVNNIYNGKSQKLIDFYNSKTFMIELIIHEDTKNVFENYFSGSGNFRKIKDRSDIPDSFIFELVKRVCTKNQSIFISGDENLQKATECFPNLKVYGSIESMFENHAEMSRLKNLYKKNSTFQLEFQLLKDAIDIDFYLTALESDHLSEEIQDLIYGETAYQYIDRKTPSEEYYIEDIDYVASPTHISDLSYLGGGEGSIQFETKSRVYVNHYVHIGDLHEYEGYPYEFVNDHVYSVTIPALVTVTCESSFQLDYKVLQQATEEGWSGKELGRNLGSKIHHDFHIIDIELEHFDLEDRKVKNGLVFDEHPLKCTVCNADLGTCGH